VALAAILASRCGTCASSVIPPSESEARELIFRNDRPLGFEAVSMVNSISIGGFNASSGTWTVQADVQYGGLVTQRVVYLVYRDTEARWAIRKQ